MRMNRACIAELTRRIKVGLSYHDSSLGDEMDRLHAVAHSAVLQAELPRYQRGTTEPGQRRQKKPPVNSSR